MQNYHPYIRYFDVPSFDPRYSYYPFEQSSFIDSSKNSPPKYSYVHEDKSRKPIYPQQDTWSYRYYYNKALSPELYTEKSKPQINLYDFERTNENLDSIEKHWDDFSIGDGEINRSFNRSQTPLSFPKSKPHFQNKYHNTKHPLSSDDLKRQEIANQNHEYVKKHPYFIDHNVETIDEQYHNTIKNKLHPVQPRDTPIYVTGFSTIDSAIYYHNHGLSNICLLNFADAKKPGGGYLNGRNAQEECLCRQTLLYPTLVESKMYQEYRNDVDIHKNDYMVYSPNVRVIRDNSNAPLTVTFNVNIISAPAVDRRKYVKKGSEIMERRIRKIVRLAAYKGNKVLILGGFGCGVFKNDPSEVANMFRKVLINEGLKNYFRLIVFPIYGNEQMRKIFSKALT